MAVVWRHYLCSYMLKEINLVAFDKICINQKLHERCIKRCCWVPPPLHWIPSHKIKKLLFKGLGGCSLWHLLFYVATSHNFTHFSQKVETTGSMLSLGNRSEARLINYLNLLLFAGWELRGWENYNCRLSYIPNSLGHYRCKSITTKILKNLSGIWLEAALSSNPIPPSSNFKNPVICDEYSAGHHWCLAPLISRIFETNLTGSEL